MVPIVLQAVEVEREIVPAVGREGPELEGAEEHDHKTPVRLKDEEAGDDGEEVGEEVLGEGAVC